MLAAENIVVTQPVRCPPVRTSTQRRVSVRGFNKRETRLSALQTEEAMTSSGWFTQPERFISIQQPSKDAKLLERAFWHHPVVDVPSTREEAVVMMDCLQRETEAHGMSDGINVVAFTGGNGPALTAYLLDSVFDGAVVGCIGGTNTVSAEQREHAAYVCDLLGIDLVEVDDATWCKFKSVGSEADDVCHTLAHESCEAANIVLFSGFTADDISRAGHQAAADAEICSPLSHLSHAAVNALSRVVGLPTGSLEVK